MSEVATMEKVKYLNIPKFSDININMVIDWDGNIQNIELKWINNFLKAKDEKIKKLLLSYYNIEEFLKKSTFEMIEFLINRKYYYLEDVFKFPNKKIDEAISNKFYEYYLNDESFYDDLPINYVFYLIKNIIESTACEKAVFLTHVGYGINDYRKEKVFNEQLLPIIDSKFHNKIEFYNLDSSISKSKFILNNYPKTNLIFDDAPKVVVDLIKNLKNIELIMVEYGYNKFIENDILDESKELYRYYKENNIHLTKIDALQNVLTQFSL